MKIKTPLAVMGVVLFGAFATGCSQQQQQADADQSQSQNADAEAPAAPAKPAAPAAAPAAKPQIDVAELQRRLKAKGYYKGPIDGNLSQATKDALAAYQGK
jgi:peptidoglycan hydrolase-like protein with peptidoglycan-binding domain